MAVVGAGWIGSFYRDVHRDHVVELALGEGVEAFEGDGSVARVRTDGGKTIDCDCVVVGIGVAPRVELARDAGLEIDNGIVVDALNQGPAAARAMLGLQVSYDRIPYFFSGQYEVGMEYSGHVSEGIRWCSAATARVTGLSPSGCGPGA